MKYSASRTNTPSRYMPASDPPLIPIANPGRREPASPYQPDLHEKRSLNACSQLARLLAHPGKVEVCQQELAFLCLRYSLLGACRA
jgi:hypothetical protein